MNSSEINLELLLLKVLKNYKYVLKFLFLFSIIGLIFSLTQRNIFKSSSTFYPHYEDINQPNNIRNLAGLAGINFQDEISNNIPPSLYPELISSPKFKLEILNQNILHNNSKITYKDYLIEEINQFNFIKFILKPINDLQNKIFKNNSNELEKYDSISNDLIFISYVENRLFKLLDEKIKIYVNEDDGFIELSVFDYDPLIASIIVKKANDILQQNIIDFKLKNTNDLFEFKSNQLELAKINLFKIQDSLASFKDGNINIRSDIFKNQLERIQTEYNIAKNIYNELAITVEKAAIDVRKNTPIFTVINDVVIPLERNNPSRILVIIIFGFIGFIISVLIIIFKKEYYSLIKKLK